MLDFIITILESLKPDSPVTVLLAISLMIVFVGWLYLPFFIFGINVQLSNVHKVLKNIKNQNTNPTNKF